MKNISAVLLYCSLFYSCANHGQLKFLSKLPSDLKENSGIAYYQGDSAWLVADSGNHDIIYNISFDGEQLNKLEVKNAKNRDWEELTEDKEGNLYIGDFGNNRNDRKDLTIYKLPNPDVEKGDKIDAEKITFSYPEQKDFPAKKKDRLFDAEALFHYQGNLYIFTKNRANPFTGETRLYKVPDSKGDYEAQFIAKLDICDDWETCRITSADISDDGKTVVLLGYGKIWLFTGFTNDNFFDSTSKEIDLGVRTQLESVTFASDNTLLISDEKSKAGGGNLYSFQLPSN
ncbi:hypothetical protein D1013_18390 [Euzebyella marina]|uniref:T9SS C-terminal target domain-containing protein n=1 Tax=Euzebyella marina TaxID=1761453 RepID=A0A3G2LAC3_9FLAO|nr:hypothetical protein [Euzebyella marina]AYN69215.1 hypothetical protein D1013_18390 [Euzebyella marina]